MTTVIRWALYSKEYGFYRPLPHKTELLFESRGAAEATRLSASVYNYRPVKVELHHSDDRDPTQDALDPADPLVSISDSFLTNLLVGETKPPEGEDWVAILFCKKRSGKEYCTTVSGSTLKERDAAVRRFAKKHKLTVTEEKE